MLLTCIAAALLAWVVAAVVVGVVLGRVVSLRDLQVPRGA